MELIIQSQREERLKTPHYVLTIHFVSSYSDAPDFESYIFFESEIDKIKYLMLIKCLVLFH